jgi:hypothetical protein
MRRNDILDALAAWQGAPVDAARREELLARLRTDDAFRKELAEALWTLSMVRVVQAPEPRWLGLSEELGLLDDEEGAADEDAEQVLMAEIRGKPHRLWVSRRWRTMAMVSAGLAALLMIFLFIGRDGDVVPEQFAVAPLDERKLAVVSGETGAVWDGDPLIAGGKWLRPGAQRLLSGSETLVFSDGVRVRLQAPVDFNLLDRNAISCRRGAVRVRLPVGTEGFRVDVPFGTVTDLGTDFAVSVGADDGTKVAVFEGEVEIAIRQRENDGIRLLSMTKGEAMQVAVDGSTRPADAKDLPPPPDMALPPLKLSEAYADRILAGKPRHYWRLNRMEDGVIPDETGNGNPLVPVGTVEISADTGRRNSLRLSGDGGLESQKPWRFGREGAALELWFVSEGSARTALTGLSPGKSAGQHFALLGYNDHVPEANADYIRHNGLRFLTRWPVGRRGGVNLFSEPVIDPYSWHHVVIQLKDRRMELHADGLPVKTATADALPESIDVFLTFGFAYTLRQGGIRPMPERFLNGRMAEIAVYDRVLSLEEIRERCSRKEEIAAHDTAPVPEKIPQHPVEATE